MWRLWIFRKKIKNIDLHVNVNVYVFKGEVDENSKKKMLKGKEKLFSGNAFDDSGALSQKAIKIIHSGDLEFISKKFKK